MRWLTLSLFCCCFSFSRFLSDLLSESYHLPVTALLFCSPRAYRHTHLGQIFGCLKTALRQPSHTHTHTITHTHTHLYWFTFLFRNWFLLSIDRADILFKLFRLSPFPVSFLSFFPKIAGFIVRNRAHYNVPALSPCVERSCDFKTQTLLYPNSIQTQVWVCVLSCLCDPGPCSDCGDTISWLSISSCWLPLLATSSHCVLKGQLWLLGQSKWQTMAWHNWSQHASLIMLCHFFVILMSPCQRAILCSF